MKRLLILSAIVALLLNSGCSNGQSGDKTTLSVSEFAERIKQIPAVPVIDVRTPEEFAKGHLQNARNIDWNGNDFLNQISTLDKSKPVLVYCLSGMRSEAAASKMRAHGFKEVFELKGGIMKWRAAGYPETTNTVTAASSGMTKEQFDKLLSSDKLVLVDFFADWCAPCKKMKPSLDEISAEMKDKVEVIRINADDHQGLCKELKVDALPVLQLYKNKSLTWTHTGYLDKKEIVKVLE
jgi:thioredoxin 1